MTVAVKRLLRTKITDEENVMRFRDEIMYVLLLANTLAPRKLTSLTTGS